jgi:hypothetical protein
MDVIDNKGNSYKCYVRLLQYSVVELGATIRFSK